MRALSVPLNSLRYFEGRPHQNGRLGSRANPLIQLLGVPTGAPSASRDIGRTLGRQPIGDRLGRPHVKDSVFTIRTEKTGTLVIAPIVAPLARSIAATDTGELTFLATERGKPFGKESFGNWFAKACRAAGVPGSAHGLRKAGARRIAERGGSEALLNALYGWKEGSRESATYVATANRARMAIEAAKLLAMDLETEPAAETPEGQTENKTPAPGDPVRALG